MFLRSLYLRLGLLFPALLLSLAASTLRAQLVIVETNDEGVSGPCVGIGLGLLLEKKCVESLAGQGFLKQNEVGHSGMTLGVPPDRDGVVTSVEPGSPAASAGIKTGDLILAVDGKPVRPTPANIVDQQTFGSKDETVTLKIRRAGADRDVELKRVPAKAPNPPKVSGIMIATRPVMDWRGKYIACMSIAGPTGIPTLALCESKFKKNGYIRASELGATGLVIDPTRLDAAIVARVEPNSPAAAAGIQPGDQVVSVNNQPFTESISVAANIALFGKIGDKRTVTVRPSDAKQSDASKTVELILIAK